MADGTVTIQVKSNASQASKDFEKLDKSLDRTEDSAKKTDKAFSGLSSAAKSLGVVIAGIGIVDFTKDTIKAGFRITALQNKFKAAANGIENGAASLQFVKDITDELGLSFLETAGAYSGFVAAATRSGLTFKETEQIFRDIATAATSLQLPAERVGLVFTALEQISSKGVVSMEELRRQLGDSLPGAFEIAAKSMGKTTVEFNKMVANGEVLSKEFLPNFAKAIRQELGGSAEDAANSLQASFTRVSNSFTILKSEITREGTAVNEVFKFLAVGIEEINKQITAFLGTSEAAKLTGFKLELRDVNSEIVDLSGRLNEIGLRRSQRSFDFLKDVDTEIIKQLNEEMSSLIKTRDELSLKIKDLTKDTTDNTESIQENVETYEGLTKQLRTAKKAYLDALTAQEATSDELLVLEGNYRLVEDRLEEVKRAFRGMGDEAKEASQKAGEDILTVGDAIDTVSSRVSTDLIGGLIEGENAFDALGKTALNILNDITQELAKLAIKKALIGAFGGGDGGTAGLLESIGSAVAGGFSGGASSTNPVPTAGTVPLGPAFSTGGIVGDGGGMTSGTTFFGNNGKLSVAGEKGAEAIMPTKRLSGGDYGVKVEQTPITTNIYNQTDAQVEVIQRRENEQDIFIRRVDNALNSSRINNSFEQANQRLSPSGIQAV